jgi:hypothetical protein
MAAPRLLFGEIEHVPKEATDGRPQTMKYTHP